MGINSDEVQNRLGLAVFPSVLTISPEVFTSLNGILPSIRQIGGEENEAKLLQNILLCKATDNAIQEDRTTVNNLDVEKVFRFCIPFIWRCHQTTILNNPFVSASVLSAADSRLLQIVGIERNEQLASANAEAIANAIMDKVIQAGRNIEITGKEGGIMLRRVKIWQIEAQLLSNRRGTPTSSRTNTESPGSPQEMPSFKTTELGTASKLATST